MSIYLVKPIVLECFRCFRASLIHFSKEELEMFREDDLWGSGREETSRFEEVDNDGQIMPGAWM